MSALLCVRPLVRSLPLALSPFGRNDASYELCEDLANLLTQTAGTMQFSLGITEHDVLERCQQGLLLEDSVVTPTEAQWVICRLAELMQWPMPAALTGAEHQAS
ncbi:hypothetical protein [Rhodoferax aquaticus]|uniref:ATPase with chaperone activity n=1 Tax=Rhodoferax aquaticus TaxID=2527691 RepID=A0A515EU20_9BURK|nr:hypothetical protein [Rhodoferax aquaticus]QDL56177.1 hypothetical protein EXZ61_19550 [Rhodoferax aquaticus]